tara:strand:- start:182 stop:823 length:642 start_codon:yes stop_codon:yes gene_type:complete
MKTPHILMAALGLLIFSPLIATTEPVSVVHPKKNSSSTEKAVCDTSEGAYMAHRYKIIFGCSRLKKKYKSCKEAVGRKYTECRKGSPKESCLKAANEHIKKCNRLVNKLVKGRCEGQWKYMIFENEQSKTVDKTTYKIMDNRSQGGSLEVVYPVCKGHANDSYKKNRQLFLKQYKEHYTSRKKTSKIAKVGHKLKTFLTTRFNKNEKPKTLIS